jgi:hypothetical protein
MQVRIISWHRLPAVSTSSGVAQFAGSVGAERIAVSDAAVQTYTSGSKIKLHKRIKVIPVS